MTEAIVAPFCVVVGAVRRSDFLLPGYPVDNENRVVTIDDRLPHVRSLGKRRSGYGVIVMRSDVYDSGYVGFQQVYWLRFV